MTIKVNSHGPSSSVTDGIKLVPYQLDLNMLSIILATNWLNESGSANNMYFNCGSSFYIYKDVTHTCSSFVLPYT